MIRVHNTKDFWPVKKKLLIENSAVTRVKLACQTHTISSFL